MPMPLRRVLIHRTGGRTVVSAGFDSCVRAPICDRYECEKNLGRTLPAKSTRKWAIMFATRSRRQR